ncbi:D-3-phosphoglycerate dehydrogenase [Thermoplasma volcanium GSS1]|uniref:D-3-phosphoglycerate dehydrogenase n=1 Tax=Thermoplasma volcanium (strain ATCC 51530 / DSM 4299 / JCM 9571 / NBRC 15438 / GSS1) TaxID=273116 RepID=Q97A21_THEVO|nr:2-hydroxyacid dehydrogenase [Thermoplasma volcanium]BAB60131.1 D-3-phosphoglycerate dehydrogenase [Thermoplasma volcanium GSS1]
MHVYVNFPVEDKFKKIGESILDNYDVHWYPDYYDADAILIKNTYVIGKNTKMIQTLSAGVDHIDVQGIPENVVLCSNAGAYSISVAEHAFALLLARAKNVIENDMNMKNGKFIQSPTKLLYSKTLGILGYGGIGRRVAELGKAFGMDIAVFTRTLVKEGGVRFYKEPGPVLENSDVVVISLPLTDNTRGMINSSKLEMMKKDAMLINVARADIVVKEDILKHLISNPDFTYISDVWWNEPNITETNIKNTILSPHIAGGMSGEIMELAYEQAFRNIKAFFEGKPNNIVRKEEYKKRNERFVGI